MGFIGIGSAASLSLPSKDFFVASSHSFVKVFGMVAVNKRKRGFNHVRIKASWRVSEQVRRRRCANGNCMAVREARHVRTGNNLPRLRRYWKSTPAAPMMAAMPPMT